MNTGNLQGTAESDILRVSSLAPLRRACRFKDAAEHHDGSAARESNSEKP